MRRLAAIALLIFLGLFFTFFSCTCRGFRRALFSSPCVLLWSIAFRSVLMCHCVRYIKERGMISNTACNRRDFGKDSLYGEGAYALESFIWQELVR
eukprot:481461-Pyramimonas_sp.AAC.1